MNLHDALLMAKQLMAEHGLNNWNFKFDRAKVRFGLCSYKTQTISLSAELVSINDEAKVRDTILHEIAHALAPRGSNHNYEWQRVARSIGCTAMRCHDATTPDAPWLLVCPNCDQRIKRFRRTNSKRACKRCCDRYNYGRFTEEFVMTWQRSNND